MKKITERTLRRLIREEIQQLNEARSKEETLAEILFYYEIKDKYPSNHIDKIRSMYGDEMAELAPKTGAILKRSEKKLETDLKKLGISSNKLQQELFKINM